MCSIADVELLSHGTLDLHEDVPELLEDPVFTCERFLQASSFNMSKSNKNLVDYVSWRSSSSRISEQDIQSSLEDGKVFMLESADTSGGPCVIVVARQHNKHTTPLDETIKLLTFTLDKAVDRMEDAGVTKGTLILDLAGATSKSLDVTALKSLVMFFSIYFPERIRTAVFYKPPSIFGYIWKLISPFMSDRVREVMRFASKPEELHQFVDPSRLPRALGGEASDATMIPIHAA